MKKMLKKKNIEIISTENFKIICENLRRDQKPLRSSDNNWGKYNRKSSQREK